MDFMRLLFGIIMLHVRGASASVYISTTSRGYTSTETGNPFFECYRSSPYLNADVSRGRYVYVYNDINGIPNPANDDPPPRVAIEAGNPPTSQAYRINLETTDHRSYGAFYCAASLDGERSVVPTVFLRSDAKFVPTSGRFSKTVNKGDVNVTVDFTEVTPSVGNKVWRFNGTTDPVETISADTIFTELTVYTIIGEVDTSNGGVYELHLEVKRAFARAGLLRLIVRACPAGRYDVSSGCTQLCPSCYNGGICHDQTEICICPPGFQGNGCEIACGGNRYGRICEYRCDYEISDDRTACSGFQVCVPDPYGCSCTPGYKGLDCTTECNQSEFGASCTETCHCVSGECDRFTGVCTGSSTECEPGWTGTNCQECMIGRYGPNCEPFTVKHKKTNKGQRTVFVCCLEGGNLISTAPVVNLYRKFGSENYARENIIPSGNGDPPNENFLFLVLDVKVGEIFVCSLSDVNNFFSDTITTDGEFTQPELPSAPVVSGATNDSVTLMWDAWDASTDIGDPPLVGYRVYYRLNNSQVVYQEVIRSDGLAPSETVTGLSPDTDYMFGVAAVRPGVGGQGRRLDVEGTTQCSPPSEGPLSVYITKGTRPGEILLSWENPPPDAYNCASGVGGIRIYFTRSDIQSAISKRAAGLNENSIDISLTSEYTLTLEPYSQYLIHVVVYNKDYETPRGEGFTQITEEMLAPAPTVTVEATFETVTVLWDAASPAHLNGDVRGYQLRYTRTKPEPLDPVLVNVTNQLTGNKYVITEGVTKDSQFEIEVRVLNGAGCGEWSPLMTSPLPGDESRYSLRALLLTGLIPSIILICVICIILIVGFFRRRQPDKGENEKNTQSHDETQSPGAANTYQDLYERVSNDGTAYQELELTSVQQGDTNYINIEEGPRGRKNILKSIENADC